MSSPHYDASNVKSDEMSIQHNLKQSRSLPIPKEVNQFVLVNFGAAYYNSDDFQSRQQILRTIENHLRQAGYGISSGEIERRLKNMKSHYRRKRSDLDHGSARKIDWQYFDILDQIFTRKRSTTGIASQSSPNSAGTTTPLKTEKSFNKHEIYSKTTSNKRHASLDPAQTTDDEPEDLSVKKIKVESQPATAISPPPATISTSPENPIGNYQLNVGSDSYQKILEGLRLVNEHRTFLSNQIEMLESKRKDLDNLGLQLTNFLVIYHQIESGDKNTKSD